MPVLINTPLCFCQVTALKQVGCKHVPVHTMHKVNIGTLTLSQVCRVTCLRCVCVCVVTGLSRQSVRRTEQDFQPVEVSSTETEAESELCLDRRNSDRQVKG